MKETLKRWLRYHELKQFYKRYERVLIPGMLLLGVAADFITFQSINIGTAFILLGSYAILAGIAIAILNTKSSGYLRLAAPLIIQFTFGALLSASLIFYWFSGAFSVSWPLLGVIAALMVSNESLRHYLMRPVVQLSVYGFILFSLSSLVLPYLFNSIDAWVFALSGLVSFSLISLYIRVLSSADSINQKVPHLAAIILLIYGSMAFLYVSGVIPPIPLSLREAGAYHTVVRTSGGYQLSGEAESLLDRLMPGQVLHLTNGKGATIFTSIFAPADLNTTIVHVWYFYDESKEKWVAKERLAFPINGGRSAGYRGFSRKSVVEPGRWRVDVTTEHGAVLGRIRFDVVRVAELPELQKTIR